MYQLQNLKTINNISSNNDSYIKTNEIFATALSNTND